MSSRRRVAVVSFSNTNLEVIVPEATASTPPSSETASAPETTANLTSIFECPVCMDFALPPIYQCSNGHLLCSNCQPLLDSCPTCRGELGNIRNLGLEQIARMVEFPCKHVNAGCKEKFLADKKEEHEEICEFRPYECPSPGALCFWEGELDGVLNHLTSQHKNVLSLYGDDIIFLATDLNLPGIVDWVMMQVCFGQHFLLTLEKQEKINCPTQYYIIVQMIGTRRQAEQFEYKLELKGHRRRLTWEAAPRPIHETITTIIRNTDCLVFDTSIVKLFTSNGNLAINVTISPVS